MQSWGLTDPGCIRAQNQDAYQIETLDRNTLLCVVCDGMGGAKSGNIASKLAIDVFVQEPVPEDHPYLKMKHPERMRLAPHIAWASVEARERLVGMMADNVRKGW